MYVRRQVTDDHGDVARRWVWRPWPWDLGYGGDGRHSGRGVNIGRAKRGGVKHGARPGGGYTSPIPRGYLLVPAKPGPRRLPAAAVGAVLIMWRRAHSHGARAAAA